jgi:CheY-like chemotaxis protein
MLQKIKVLVVEDEKIICLDIKRSLERSGYEVVATADSYEDAVAKTKENLPDVIIMDIMLKGSLTGIEAAKTITDMYNVPIIYLTALSANETRLSAHLKGKLFHYLVKPVDTEDLLNIMLKVTEKKRNRE